MVTCLRRGADLHMAQLMPLPLTISCSSKSRLVHLPSWFCLVLAHRGSPGQNPEGCKMVVVVVVVVVVCLKNDTYVAHYNFIAHQLILVIFGREVAERVCYRMMICYPTSPNLCLCTILGNAEMQKLHFFSHM